MLELPYIFLQTRVNPAQIPSLTLKQSHRTVEASWNVMSHGQKPDFVFRRNGRVHLNRRGASVQSATGNRVVRISGSNAGFTMFRGSVKSTGYPLHSPVSPILPLPCVTVYHHILTGVYLRCSTLGVKMYRCGLHQRFSNFFQVGTTFISQNVLRTTFISQNVLRTTFISQKVLRTTLLLGLSNSLGLS